MNIKSFSLIIFFTLFSFAFSFSQTYECINVESPDWVQGTKILTQKKDSIEVTLIVTDITPTEVIFDLKISNTTSKKFTVNPRSIYAYRYWKDTTKKEKHIYKAKDPETAINNINKGDSNASLDYWKNTAFRITTIKPGFHHKGNVHLKMYKSVMFIVYIPIGEEVFEFVFLKKGYVDIDEQKKQKELDADGLF